MGGVAASLNGAPVNTNDLHVVFARDPENIDRIMPALESLDAFFRMQPERRLRPNRSHVGAGGHLLLTTRFGSFDLLGTIGENLGYEELLPNSQEMDIGQGLRVRVLNLETIIQIKEQLRRDKDLAVAHPPPNPERDPQTRRYATVRLIRSHSALNSQPTSAIAATRYIQTSSAIVVPTVPYMTL